MGRPSMCCPVGCRQLPPGAEWASCISIYFPTEQGLLPFVGASSKGRSSDGKAIHVLSSGLKAAATWSRVDTLHCNLFSH